MQGGADRASNPANDVVTLKINMWCICLMRTTGILRERPNIENY